jgi:hypothetical protein
MAGVLSAVLTVLAGWYVLTQWSRATVIGASKRTTADIRSVSEAVEQYREDHGRYPTTSRMNELQSRVQGYSRKLPTQGISYCSDGVDYVISAVPLYVSSEGPRRYAAVVLRNGHFVSWPEHMNEHMKRWALDSVKPAAAAE